MYEMYGRICLQVLMTSADSCNKLSSAFFFQWIRDGDYTCGGVKYDLTRCLPYGCIPEKIDYRWTNNEYDTIVGSTN